MIIASTGIVSSFMINLLEPLILNIQGLTIDFNSNFYNTKPGHYFEEPTFNINTSKLTKVHSLKGTLIYKSDRNRIDIPIDVDTQFDNVILNFPISIEKEYEPIDPLKIINFTLPIKTKRSGTIYLYQNGTLLTYYLFRNSFIHPQDISRLDLY